MTKAAGRDFFLKKNATTIAGARNVSVTVNSSPINVEDQSDSGYATHLSGVFTGQSLEISIEGYQEGEVLRDLYFGPASGRFASDITLVFPNGDEVSGDFVLTTYGEAGAYEDGQTFTATLVSDGAWTFTGAV